MPQPGFYNTGPTLTLTITRNDTNAVVTLDGDRDDFTAKEKPKLIESDNCAQGGLVTAMKQPGGWEGSFSVEKNGDAFALFISELEADILAGNGQIYCTMKTTEPNGQSASAGTSSFQYTNVVFYDYDIGSYKRTDIVKPKCSFFASTRQPA